MSGHGRPPGDVDVLVLGEILVEVSSREPWRQGTPAQVAFSGDALNVAAAAAAAGASTAIVARVPDDDLGDALVARVAALGVDVTHLVRVRGQHGVYFSHTDPQGRREFAYARAGSAGAGLKVADLDDDLLRRARVVVASGISCAISPSAADAVRHAARSARRFVYDPNFRPRLTTAAAAAAHLRELAPLAAVVTPSWPGESGQLLHVADGAPPEEALAAACALGAGAVVLTCGERGALVAVGGEVLVVPAVRAPHVVDQTGAGDCLTGSVAARIALGDPLPDAVRFGVAAAALSVQGVGGTGHVPTAAQTRAALAGANPVEVLR